MRFKSRLFPCRILFVWVLFVLSASAEVFQTTGRIGGGMALNAGMPRWQNAYETTMVVNGRKNAVQLYSIRYTEPALDQLVQRFKDLGAEVSVVPGSGGATGIARWPDREARFLVLSPSSEPRHLVFVFYPDPGALPEPVRFPVSKYPGASVLQTVSDEKTDIFVATLSSPDSSAQVHDYYVEKMAAEGWSRILPAVVSDGTVRGLATYVKGTKVFYVQAESQDGGPSSITLLVKGKKL